MTSHLKIIVDKYAPEYFADLVNRKLLNKEDAEEQMREVLYEITDQDNASEAGTEDTVESFYALLK